MKKYLLIFIALVTTNQIGFTQTITCMPPTDVCEMGSYVLPYTATGFTPGGSNVFTAELSDETGSFASPIFLGILPTTVSVGNININMPSSFLPGGTYFIRVNSSDIPVTGNSEFINTIKPYADAGSDQGICYTVGSANLFGSATGHTSIEWTSSGSGTFSPNNASLNPAYIPNFADEGQTITLTMKASNSACPVSDSFDDMLLTVEQQSVVNVGSDITICANENVNLSASLTGLGGIWSSSGTGIFDNVANINAVYTPDANDITNGSVYLTLLAIGGGYCSAVTDDVFITINPGISLNVGSNISLCAEPSTVLTATYSFAGGVQWTSLTGGSFSSTTTGITTYSPSGAEYSAGQAIVYAETTDNGLCLPARDTVFITLYNAPVIDAGSVQTICSGLNVSMAGFVNGGPQTPTMFWSTTGTGSFTDINDPFAMYSPSGADYTAGFVQLIANAVHGSCLNYRDTMQVNFTPGPTASFSVAPSACAFSEISFTDLSTVGSGSIVAHN